MTQNLTISLIARGLAAAAAMLQLKQACKHHPSANDDVELQLALDASEAQLRVFTETLRRQAFSASGADIEMALCHASQSSFFDFKAWNALIEKLSSSRVKSDQEMAQALQMFA